MADKKISQLTAASTPLAGTEVLPIVQSGSTFKVSVADITAGRDISATSVATGLGAVGTPSHTFTGDPNTGMWSPAADTISLSTNGGERLRVVSGGAIGINRTSPAGYGQLAVRWDPTATTVNNGTGISIDVANDTTNATFVNFVNQSGGGIGSITRVAQTNAVAYNVSSDRRLKENILPSDDPSQIIDAIEIVKHDWKGGGSVRYGVIAQDLRDIVPEVVSRGDPDDVEQPKRPWGVDYSKLVPILIKEVQSLRKRVADLEDAGP